MINEITPQIAAMYIGQKCDVEWLRGDEFSAIKKGEVFIDCLLHYSYVGRIKSGEAKIIPHLRRLSSITSAEAKELYEIRYGDTFDVGLVAEQGHIDYIKDFWEDRSEEYKKEKDHMIGKPSAWLYLLGKGFDLFDLIDNGLAKEIGVTA